VWILGDLADDDRHHGMGIVVEYANRAGKPQWVKPKSFRWDYTGFAKAGATAPEPDETFDMTFAKDNAAEEGFNRWTINGIAYPMSNEMAPASFHLKQGKRYRLRMRNASDDIHPIHLHRHSFELTNLAGTKTAGVMKDVIMLSGYQQAEVDFVADNPGLTLFHCHQQLHMDFDWLDQANAWSDNPVGAFDFPLRWRLRELCDNYGFSLRTLVERNVLMWDRPAQAVTFVENHDVVRDTPIINDKLLAYAIILTHEGYPCVFWQDYFNWNLAQPENQNGIDALVKVHEQNAARFDGSALRG
jgi:hypothetical protein